MSELPEGFVIDRPASAAIPEGFVLDEPSIATDVARSAMTSPMRGLLGLAGLPGDAQSLVRSLIEKYGLQPANYKYAQQLPQSQDVVKAFENVAGPLYQARTTPGEYVQTIGEFLPAMGGGPETLGARFARQVVAPAVTSETAGQLTKGTAAEAPARVLTALATGHVATPSAAKAAIPTIEEIKDAARAGYKAPEVAAVQIKPSAVQGLAAQIENDLVKEGFRPTAKSASDTFAEVRAMRPPSGVSSVSVADIDNARKALGKLSNDVDAVGKATPEAVAAGRAVRAIDDFLPNLKQPDLLAGDAAQASAILGEARGNWGAAKRAELAATKMENARIQAASTYGGGNINNALRQAYRPLEVNNYAKTASWSPEAQAALKDVVEGRFLRNAARDIGRIAPTGGLNFMMHLAGGVPTALATGGASLPAQIALAGGTYAAKKLGELGTRNAARRLTETLLKESPLARQQAAAFTPQPRLDPVIAALMSGILASTQPRLQLAR